MSLVLPRPLGGASTPLPDPCTSLEYAFLLPICLVTPCVLLVLCARDLERLENPVYSVQGHGSIINAIDGVGGQDVGYGAPELVTGSRDGASCGSINHAYLFSLDKGL